MSLSTDEVFLAAVAAALGETISLVRRHGFHFDQPTDANGVGHDCDRTGMPADTDEDAFDLAAYGVDWDADHDRRFRRRPRHQKTRRGSPRAA